MRATFERVHHMRSIMVRYAPAVFLAALLASLVFAPATFAQRAVTLTAEADGSVHRVKIDDGLFSGCYHNAFEGLPIRNDDGTYKAGEQAVQRTKGVITGAGTGHSVMTLTFDLPKQPAGDVKLILTGIDDRFEQQNVLRLALNDKTVGSDIKFNNNENEKNGLNMRYFLGWHDVAVTLPKAQLKQGKNVLSITNTTSAFESERWTYAIIDYAHLEFSEPTKLTIDAPEMPIFYYGLLEGVETNIWPQVNIDNRICLTTNGVVEMNFFATMPHELPLGTKGSLKDNAKLDERNIQLHIETDGDITLMDLDCKPIEGERSGSGVRYTQPISRLVKFETPHPSQGVTLFALGNSNFEGKTLKAWYSVDGVDYAPTTMPLRSVTIEPVEGRDELDFTLGIWGGRVPADDNARQNYIDLVKNAGFRQLFTGNAEELNKTLAANGFEVFPRFGWFGHQFKVTDETIEHVAIKADGTPEMRDFCPLAILANQDHPHIGRYFHTAREMAKQEGIDGLCVDYETAAVWCWCEKCIKLFNEETGRSVTDRAVLSGDGELADEYRDFGRRRNRDLLTRVKTIMQEVNPELEYHSLASASDIPSYWYDGRIGGRHAVRELVKFADNIYTSVYCYELPGGIKSISPIVQTVDGYALESGREVGTSVISPIATTVSELPRYRATRMRPDLTRLMALATAISGGKGLLIFRGDCFDGEYYLAFRQAMEELVAIKPYLDQNINRNFELDITPEANAERVHHTEVAQNLLSRLVWRPDVSYFYDGFQLLGDATGNDRLITILNYSSDDMTFNVRVRGLYDPMYELRNIKTGEVVGQFSRLDVESGKVKVTVPARDALLLQLVSLGSAK